MLTQAGFSDLAGQARLAAAGGEVNNFIPALGRFAGDHFGAVLIRQDGAVLETGATDEPFSIQSISKLFAMMLLQSRAPERLWRRVGQRAALRERFDSIATLEFCGGIPANPFLNAGALVATDLLLGLGDAPEAMIADLLSHCIGAPLRINEAVARSEIETADRNRALAWYLRSCGNLDFPPDRVVEQYCRLCAIEMTCRELAAFAESLRIMATGGASALTAADAQRALQIMAKGGLYEESSDIDSRFGIQAKSGSGGGIMAILPGIGSLGVWSPALNPVGNSAAGMAFLRQIARNAV